MVAIPGRQEEKRCYTGDGIQSKKFVPYFQNIANADYISLMLLGFVNHKEDPEGKREEARRYRRAIVRYINLAIVETLRTVSVRTAKRFRTYEELVACSESTLRGLPFMTSQNFLII